MCTHIIDFQDRKLKTFKGTKGSCLTKFVEKYPEKKAELVKAELAAGAAKLQELSKKIDLCLGVGTLDQGFSHNPGRRAVLAILDCLPCFTDSTYGTVTGVN